MVKAYEATIPATRRDTNGGGRRRRTKGDAIDALLALGDNIAKHVGAAIEIAEFFSNFCPCVSDRRESLRLLSLEVVSSPLTYVFFFSLPARIIESEGNLSPPYGRACKSSWYAGTDRLRVEDRYEYSRFDLEFNGTRSVDSIRVERCTGIILVSWSKIKSH